jgi:hypothetical protein
LVPTWDALTLVLRIPSWVTQEVSRGTTVNSIANSEKYMLFTDGGLQSLNFSIRAREQKKVENHSSSLYTRGTHNLDSFFWVASKTLALKWHVGKSVTLFLAFGVYERKKVGKHCSRPLEYQIRNSLAGFSLRILCHKRLSYDIFINENSTIVFIHECTFLLFE